MPIGFWGYQELLYTVAIALTERVKAGFCSEIQTKIRALNRCGDGAWCFTLLVHFWLDFPPPSLRASLHVQSVSAVRGWEGMPGGLGGGREGGREGEALEEPTLFFYNHGASNESKSLLCLDVMWWYVWLF